MNWVLREVEGRAVAAAKPSEVHRVEADELWAYVGKNRKSVGCGGLVIVLPGKSADGRWTIVEPERPGAWMRSFLMATAPLVEQ
ncbi:MAG: hypothetical protein LBK99_19530 [Opitutaceae bacterium]|nr:hypothetical protein [Opitutaceae bacterium]